MPLFEYKCDNPSCGYIEEKLQTYAEREATSHGGNCPKCTIGVMMRQISSIGYTPMKWGDTLRSGQI